MRFVDRDCVAPQLAVELFGALARFQPFDERRSAAKRDIDRARVLIDQMKILRHGAKRQFAAVDAILKGFDNAVLVKCFPAQRAQFAEIALHGFLHGGVSPVFQSMACCAYRRAEQKRRQFCPLEDGDDAFLRCSFPLAVAAPRCLQDGIQPSQLAVHRGKVHVHARLDQRGRHDAARFPRL